MSADRKNVAIKNIALSYINNTPEVISETELLNHVRSINFLENILQFSQTAFLIIEYKNWTYTHCSSNAAEVIGHAPKLLLEGGPAYGLKAIHPDDLAVQEKIHRMAVDVFLTLTEADKKNYKFSFTSRVSQQDGKEVQLLQNNFFLKWDNTGRPLLKLITFTDITAYKTNNDIVFYITKTNAAGDNEIIIQKNFNHQQVALSRRELEIIELTSKGLTAKETAARTSISEQTVKNHKKNIMRKLGCANSAQMVTLASLYGLIGFK